MSITIVIPVKNDAIRLRRCLDSIARAGRQAAPEIVVADNGSTDTSPTVASDAGAHVLQIPNVAVGELRNVAARSASGTVLAFIDADHELESGWFEAADESFQDPAVGAAGALYLSPPGGTWVQRMYGALRGQTVGRGETDWLGSGNLLVKRDIFENLSGFDTSLEACEDVDLCRRIRAAGWQVIGDERLRSVHHGDPKDLAALFRAELWRGRDNLRVSLKGPISLRDLPSIVTPVLTLAGFVMLVIGLLGFGGGVRLVSIASIMLAGIVGVRASRMAAKLGSASPIDVGRTMIVALTYEIARALALVIRAPHHRR